MTIDPRSAAHWNTAYADGDTTRSWFQTHPTQSLKMLDAAGTTPGDSVIDAGGGASTLADALLHRGFHDITVLDLSQTGLRTAQHRLGTHAHRVQWIVADLLTWQPPRHYQVWHDRAVFHFLTTTEDRQRYLATMNAATTAHSIAVFGCFAPDGPRQCSGLATARYNAHDLAGILHADWTPVTDDHELHETPTAATQPMTWAVFRRRPNA